MKLIYIYGPPGVGKLTVSRELAKITGYRLFHNQLSIEFVKSVFPFGSAEFNRLVLKFRSEIIEAAAESNVSLIFTSAYAKGLNDEIVKDIVRRVERHGGSVFFVRLYCDREELLRRISGSSRRRFSKIRSPEMIATLLDKYNHTSPIPFVKSLGIDNTRMAPSDVARLIAERCGK